MAGVGLGISGALAIGGLALSAIGTGASFAQAGKQNRLRRNAEDEAAKSMAAAEKILETNYLKGISLPKEAYEREREALLASGAQALQAGAEGSTRGAAATAGRVQMAQQAGQRNIATAQADRLLELELMGAKEDSRLQSGLANLEMMGVVGAQQAARDAQMAKQQAVQQGFQGLTKMGKTAVDYKNELIPLFSRSTPDFSSVGGKNFGTGFIKENPTLFGTYQGKQQYLPDVFKGGMDFDFGLSVNPPAATLPTILPAPPDFNSRG
jgi:hypothetical protein